jgi:hypothetical protein
MFNTVDPNRSLAEQQAIFGSANAPRPTFMERLKGKLRRNPKVYDPQTAIGEKSGPLGDTILSALYADIPSLAEDYPIRSKSSGKPDKDNKFIVISLVPEDANAVQIELFNPDLATARLKLLELTSKIEKGHTPQIAQEALILTSDRLIVHHRTIPDMTCAVCRVMPARRTHMSLPRG